MYVNPDLMPRDPIEYPLKAERQRLITHHRKPLRKLVIRLIAVLLNLP